MQVDPVEFEHLDFHALGQAALAGDGAFAPDEHARVAAGFHVTPLDVQDEVLVLFLARITPIGLPVQTSRPSLTLQVSGEVLTSTQPVRSCPLKRLTHAGSNLVVDSGELTSSLCIALAMRLASASSKSPVICAFDEDGRDDPWSADHLAVDD